jgi:regulatory protein
VDEEILNKILRYCHYQERCHLEVRTKLFSLGVRKNDLEIIIAQLIEEGSLNEERFAKAFARGKFRLKKWGRAKISSELKRRQVSQFCISKAMKEIDEGAYRDALKKLYNAKWMSLKDEKNKFIKLRKTRDHLLQKGYESKLINEVLKN